MTIKAIFASDIGEWRSVFSEFVSTLFCSGEVAINLYVQP
jgi:hypothetical protein